MKSLGRFAITCVMMTGDHPKSGPREVYFELIRLGGSIKVVAIDGATGVEVSIVGPATAAQSDLERLALAKLNARLARES